MIFVINSIIHQQGSGKCYSLLPKYLYLTCTWLKKYLMYLMSSKYSEYLNLYLQIWKSNCTWLKYFQKYLTPTLLAALTKVLPKVLDPNPASGIRKLTAAFVSKNGVLSRFVFIARFRRQNEGISLLVPQIWQSRKGVPIQIQLINSHQVEDATEILIYHKFATWHPSIFCHSRQGNLVFGVPKFRVGGPKFCSGPLICTSSKFCLVLDLVMCQNVKIIRSRTSQNSGAVCEIVFAEVIDHRSRVEMIHHRPTVYTYRPVIRKVAHCWG